MEFSKLEPFGSEAFYLGFAIVAQVIANTNRRKGSKPFKVKEFMPEFGGKPPMSAEQMMQYAEMLTYSLGGEDLRE